MYNFVYNYLLPTELNQPELPLILFFLILGFLFIFFVNDLLLLYFCIEILGFLTYILLGFSYDMKDRYEGVLKYFILNSVASLFILFGIAIFYLNTLETNFTQVTLIYLSVPTYNFLSLFGFISFFIGFIFKLGSFPCLIWIADIYESLNINILSILLTIHKFSFFYIFVKLLFYVFFMFSGFWVPLLLVSAFGSILVGTICALVQFNLKRFIAYTSISQTGYLLFSVSTCTLTGITNSINFIILYLVSTILFFLILNTTSDRNSDQIGQVMYLTDLAYLRLKITGTQIFIFIISVASLAHLPPISTFFVKYFLLQELIFTTFNYSLIIILICSLISMYYYLRLIKIFIFDLPIYYLSMKIQQFSILNTFNYIKYIFQYIYIFLISLTINQNPNYYNINKQKLGFNRPIYYLSGLKLFFKFFNLQIFLTSLNIFTLLVFYIIF
jgi:NADH-quinone oxidoreductase subunit N